NTNTNLPACKARRAPQNDLTAQHQHLGGLAPPLPPHELLTLAIYQLQNSFATTSSWHNQESHKSGTNLRRRTLVRRRDLRADQHERGVRVRGLWYRADGEVLDHPWPEYQAMGGAAVLEVSELLPLGHVRAGPDVRVDDAGRDLRHPDRHEAHQTDSGVIGLDEEERPRGDLRDVALGVVGAGRILTLDVGFRVVGALLHEGLLDGARHGAVPAVVVEGAEEGLVHRSADELVHLLVVRQHVLQ